MKDYIKVNQTTLAIIKGDITKVAADIIVNAANTSLLGGGGVDGAIHKSGGKMILEECMMIRQRQGGCSVGEAVITTAGTLPASYVVHTVGPNWSGGNNNETEKLKSCYKNSLILAKEYNAKSIAFPNISTGIYRFPKLIAAEIALESVISYINLLASKQHMIHNIYFVCFDEENYNVYLQMLRKF